MCFQQATQAYLSGNKALAKELSRKGRSHAQAMASAHQEAAERIFAERNSNMQNRGNRPMLDLHGLHVAEALSMLQRELPGCRSRGIPARARAGRDGASHEGCEDARSVTERGGGVSSPSTHSVLGAAGRNARGGSLEWDYVVITPVYHYECVLYEMNALVSPKSV